MVKYKSDNYLKPEIVMVKVEKETEAFVWIKGRREAKANSYHRYFDTFDEAKEYLVDVFTKKADSARESAERAVEKIEVAKALKEAREND